MAMKILGFIVLISLTVLAIFATLNWSALSAPTALSFITFTLEAPLGLILLGFACGFAFLLVGYASVQRTAMFVESRHHAQELRAQREIVERVEASRINDLRLQIENEAAALRTSLEEAANSLAASIGEVDDKLDRALRRADADLALSSSGRRPETGR